MTSRRFEVFLNDVAAGVLSENAEGRIGFRFSDGYRERLRRPVLSQSFEDDLERTYWGKRSGQLPTFFANLLPEGKLRSLLVSSLRAPEDDDLGLLASLGQDLPGAVSLHASEDISGGVEEAPESTGNGNGEEETNGLRFSLAGVQLKFSMIRTGERFSLPAHDSKGAWIVKIGDVEYPGVAENEYTMLSWASAAGFDVPERYLLEPQDLPAIQKYLVKGVTVLAVRRYDRTDRGPIHQEDFAQMIGSRKKYEGSYDQLGVIVRRLMGDDAYMEFVRRLVLTIAMGNSDAHLKNWSVLYRDERRPELAPLYDQVSTIAWPKIERQLALKLAGTRDFERLSSDSIRRIATKSGADADAAVAAALTTLTGLRESWEAAQRAGKLPSEHEEVIRDHWRRVPLLRESGELGGSKSGDPLPA